jgi:hypothetical protein
MPRLRIAMKRLCHRTNSLGQAWRSPGDRTRNLWQHLFRHRCHRFGHNRKQLAGCHPNQWQKVFRRLIFCLRLSGQLSQVLHHCVGIDLSDGAEFVFHLLLHLILHFFFPKQAAHHVADGAQPALAFETSLVLQLFFQLLFHLVLEFFFVLVLEFRMTFQFSLELVCHDDSSCESDRTLPGPVCWLTREIAPATQHA